MINCSLIGFGKWGKHIYKTLNEENFFKIKYICKKTNTVIKKSNRIKLVNSYKKAINDDIAAVFIASPAETHFSIAKYALENNKHVFVEKPICFTFDEFKILQDLANKKFLALHVNYIHLFNNNFHRLKKYFHKEFNKKNYIKVILGNNGPIRKNCSMIMDWAPHIYSMIIFLFNDHNLRHLYTRIFLKNNNSKKVNVYLRIKCQNKIVKVFFGNNLSKKKTYFAVKGKESKYEYFDNFNLYTNKTKKIKNNFQIKRPLNLSIESFKNLCFKKNYNINKNVDFVTLKIQELNKSLSE